MSILHHLNSRPTPEDGWRVGEDSRCDVDTGVEPTLERIHTKDLVPVGPGVGLRVKILECNS